MSYHGVYGGLTQGWAMRVGLLLRMSEPDKDTKILETNQYFFLFLATLPPGKMLCQCDFGRFKRPLQAS